jgi:hypothetical protein
MTGAKGLLAELSSQFKELFGDCKLDLVLKACANPAVEIGPDILLTGTSQGLTGKSAGDIESDCI